jgi:hypothetical protein
MATADGPSGARRIGVGSVVVPDPTGADVLYLQLTSVVDWSGVTPDLQGETAHGVSMWRIR